MSDVLLNAPFVACFANVQIRHIIGPVIMISITEPTIAIIEIPAWELMHVRCVSASPLRGFIALLLMPVASLLVASILALALKNSLVSPKPVVH